MRRIRQKKKKKSWNGLSPVPGAAGCNWSDLAAKLHLGLRPVGRPSVIFSPGRGVNALHEVKSAVGVPTLLP